MSDMDQYSSYFRPGMKVGVGIPLPNAEVFRDWAIIQELDEDFVELQLSRDQLPVRVSLHSGQILELRGGTDDNGYSVRAIIVSEGYAKHLLLRLIGEIVSDELREFYRIDAFLPIKYYISREQDPDRLHDQWDVRRRQRYNDELAKKQKRWDGTIMADGTDLPMERHHEKSPEDEHDEAWDTIIPLAANISGGGLRIMTHQGFETGEFVPVEILVPSPRRIIDVVTRVAFANRVYPAGTDRENFSTGLKFVFIDERDRDTIVNYIATVQLKRIRQLREKYLYRSVDDSDQYGYEAGTGSTVRQNIAKKIILWIVMLGIVWGIAAYFRHYMNDRPKNEIEEVFENGIKKYREKQPKY